MSDYNDVQVVDIINSLLPDCKIKGLPSLWIANVLEYDVDQLLNDGICHATELEAIEEYGSDNGLIDSDSECIEQLESFFLECYDLSTLVKLQYDDPMASEEISNIMDSWLADGELHQEQVSEYSIVIDFSKLVRCKSMSE